MNYTTMRGLACLGVLLLELGNVLAMNGPRVGRYVLIDAKTDAAIPKSLIPRNVIDYNKIGTTRINILFETSKETNSVLVTMDNPRLLFCESAAPFAIFRNHLDEDGKARFNGRDLPAGLRKVTATPFAGKGCVGEKGETFTRYIRILPKSGEPITARPTPPPTTSPTPLPVFEIGEAKSYQPKIITVEQKPARKVAGVVDLPEGSPWCSGNPTYWLPGHKYENDTPNCYVNGNWTRPAKALFDNNDDLNDIDGPEVIDRHDCAALDVNNDGLLDLYCLVGANSGRGEGYNELYLTQKDGSIKKLLKNGLQVHNGLRGRHTTVLNGSGNDQFVFISTKGGKREDGKSNKHHMYLKTGKAPDYFKEVEGPFNVYTDSTCTYKVDINNDGLDDVILCNHKKHAMLFLQGKNRKWTEVKWNQNKRQVNWRKVRVADFTGDGIPDLLITYYQDEAKIRIFRGIPEEPFFDFENRYFDTTLPYAAPDLEVLDVNGDGILDFYVVQSDERRAEPNGKLRQETYCAGFFHHGHWWRKGNQPPKDFVPPPDTAPDVLFVGAGDINPLENRFVPVTMEHSEPGCGNLVRPFGDKKLLLAQGDFVRPGHNMVLDFS